MNLGRFYCVLTVRAVSSETTRSLLKYLLLILRSLNANVNKKKNQENIEFDSNICRNSMVTMNLGIKKNTLDLGVIRFNTAAALIALKLDVI